MTNLTMQMKSIASVAYFWTYQKLLTLRTIIFCCENCLTSLESEDWQKSFESYLSNRFQYVRINKSWSKKSKINYGVPQKSNLGLLLFLMYINDLLKCTCSNITRLADHTYLSLSSSSLIHLKTQDNNEINKVDKWLRSNKRSLNYKNTSHLITNKFPQHSIDIDLKISINNIEISRSKYVNMFTGL